MDHLFYSFSDKEVTISTIKDKLILRFDGFCLHKWTANNQEVLWSLPVT